LHRLDIGKRLGDVTYEQLLAEGDPQWSWPWPQEKTLNPEVTCRFLT